MRSWPMAMLEGVCFAVRRRDQRIQNSSESLWRNMGGRLAQSSASVSSQGTNGFHGTAYAYGRGDSFDARNYFNQDPAEKTPLQLEQFHSATVGRPIKKDKLFFFANFEEQRYTVGDPASHKVPFTTHQQAPSTLNCTNGFNTAIAERACPMHATTHCWVERSCARRRTFRPQPHNLHTSFGAARRCGTFQGLFPVISSEPLSTDLSSNNRELTRDSLKAITISMTKNTLTGMYFISPGDGILADDPGQQLDPEFLTNQYARSQVGSGAWTWTPSSTWVNEARVGYSHYYQVFVSQDSTTESGRLRVRQPSRCPSSRAKQIQPISGSLGSRINGFSGWEAGANLARKPLEPDSVTHVADHVSYLRGNTPSSSAARS